MLERAQQEAAEQRLAEERMRVFTAQRIAERHAQVAAVRQTTVSQIQNSYQAMAEMIVSSDGIAMTLRSFREAYSKLSGTDFDKAMRDRVIAVFAGMSSEDLDMRYAWPATMDAMCQLDRPVTVSVYPPDAFDIGREQSPEAHAAVQIAAEQGGVVFIEEGDADLRLHFSFSRSKLQTVITLPELIRFCKDRVSSNYMIAQGMASRALGRIDRKVRLDDQESQ